MSSTSGVPEPWERISTYFAATRKSVNILVASSADAAAASISLTYLMKVFLLPFKLHPITSYDDVKSFVEQTNYAQDSERNGDGSPLVDDLFVLIGLGATVPVESFFDFTRHVVIVLDSYRPFHLVNLRKMDDDRLVIWGSERIVNDVEAFFRQQRLQEAKRRRRRRRWEVTKRQDHMKRPSTSGHHRRQRTEYDETDEGPGEGGLRDKRAPDADGDYSEESSEWLSNEDEEDDDHSEFDGTDDDVDATPSQSQERIDWRDAECVIPTHLEALYYACTGSGRSSAVEMYELSVLLHRFNDALLWHAAVGVCDLYMRRLIDYGTYLVEMAPLQEAVSLQKSVRRAALRDRTEEAVNGYHQASTNSMQLSNREEEQLYLLRHSTLWDAIWYDPLVASALELHHVEDGRPRLSQLLASRCGLSMAMAQRPWREVPADAGKDALRRVLQELQSLMNAKGNIFGYRHQIRCVSRKVGYSTEVSTFDACKLFAAEMAVVPPASLYVVASSEDLSTEMTLEGRTAIAQRRLAEFQRHQFWRARAILDMDPNEKPFHEALAAALSLQQAVADATSSLMQPGNVQSSTGIHYALPTDPSKISPTLESFCTMRRLSALAERLFFTLSWSRHNGRTATTASRPLILSCALPQVRLAAQPSADFSIRSQAPLTNVRAGTNAPATSVAGSPATLNGKPSWMSSGGGGGVPGNAAAQVEDTVDYVVVLTHGGSAVSALEPQLPLYHFLQCIAEAHFDVPPRQHFVERNAVSIRGRESTTYLTERMLLLSVKGTFPSMGDAHQPAGATHQDDNFVAQEEGEEGEEETLSDADVEEESVVDEGKI